MPARHQLRDWAGWSIAWVGGPWAAVEPVPGRGGIGSCRVAGSAARVGWRAAAASLSPRAGWGAVCDEAGVVFCDAVGAACWGVG